MAYMVEVPWLLWVSKVVLVFTLVIRTKLHNKFWVSVGGWGWVEGSVHSVLTLALNLP